MYTLFFWTGAIVWALIMLFVLSIILMVICRAIISLDFAIRIELAVQRANEIKFRWNKIPKFFWSAFKKADSQTCFVIYKSGEEVPWNTWAYERRKSLIPD